MHTCDFFILLLLLGTHREAWSRDYVLPFLNDFKDYSKVWCTVYHRQQYILQAVEQFDDKHSNAVLLSFEPQPRRISNGTSLALYNSDITLSAAGSSLDVRI